jgi:hypothetical protein
VQPEITTPPYNYAWNTTQVQNGSHTISAVARDAAGNTGTASIVVNVSNSGGSGNNIIVYNDALQSPWIDMSWGASVNFNSSEQVYSGGRSIKVTTNAWGALSAYHGAWGSPGINAANYQNLVFAVYATSSGTRLSIFFENDASQSFPQINSGTLPVNQWSVISIPKSQMNPNALVINRISIQEISGVTKTFFVDETVLTGSTPAPIPPAPVLASPSNNAVNVSTNPSLSWNASSGAEFYRLQVATSNNFSTTVADQNGITSTSFTVNGLSNSTQYYWRVNASNSSGTSSWSSVFSFTTAAGSGGGQQLIVYEESLESPWINASWNATVSFNNTEQSYEGSYSIKVAQNSWGALRVHSGQWGNSVPVNTSNYNVLQFAVHGGAVGVSIGVFFQNDQNQSFPAIRYIWIQPKQWKVISLPVTQLNPNNLVVHSLVIQDMSGRPRTFYVDNLRFNTLNLAKGDSEVEDGEITMVPETFSLDQNYPNPFNPSTVISFSIPDASEVSLKVYNMLGEEVVTLVSGSLPAGVHKYTFEAGALASGTYIYQLRAGNQVFNKKMNLVK